MDNNKYYIPTIDEFHVGFECEYQHKHSGNWTAIAIDESNFKTDSFGEYEDDYIFAIEGHQNTNHFRVKHLNKEDIISLGFKKSIYKGIASYTNSLHRLYWFDNTNVISIDNQLISNPTKIQVFRGAIRNKSELKQLLKQLHICIK